MPKKKKHRRGPRKTVHPTHGPRTRRAAEVSSQALALGQQFIGLTPDQFILRLERGLLGAVALRHEPEFEDFYFDTDHVLEATARHLERYQARFEAIRKDDAEAARELYDEMRIDIIADLVTPTVRQDLQKRADQCLDRLKRGRDADKLEMALYVNGLLGGMDQTLPLGLCGLFTAIYEDSRRSAWQVYEAQQVLWDKITGGLSGQKKPDVEQLLELAQQPETIAEFTQTLNAYPELRAGLEKDLDRVVKEVGQAIQRGEILADFFTDEEIMLTYVDMYNALEDMKTPDREAAHHKWFELMERNLAELITPERSRQFRQRLELKAQEAMRSNDHKQHEMGMKMRLAALTLDSWGPGLHPFFYEAYIHQAEQMRQQGIAQGASPEQDVLFRRLQAERKARSGRA